MVKRSNRLKKHNKQYVLIEAVDGTEKRYRIKFPKVSYYLMSKRYRKKFMFYAEEIKNNTQNKYKVSTLGCL